MIAKYEICPTLAEADAKLAAINGLPFMQVAISAGKAQTYRENFPHPDPEDARAIGIVEEKLEVACAGMTSQQRLDYYNQDNLSTLLEVYEDGWFPEEW